MRRFAKVIFSFCAILLFSVNKVTSLATFYDNKLLSLYINHVVYILKTRHPRFSDDRKFAELSRAVTLFKIDEKIVNTREDLVRELSNFCDLFKDPHLEIYDKLSCSNSSIINQEFFSKYNIEYQIFYFKIPTFKQNQFISERDADLGDDLILCFPKKEFIGGFRKAYQSYCPDIIYYLPINYEHFCDYVYPNLVGV